MITKDDLKLLRQADYVSICYNEEGLASGNISEIGVTLKHEHQGREFEQRESIPVDFCLKTLGYGSPKPRRCYASNAFPRYPEWQGIVAFLKPGDNIKVIWRENQNGYSKEATSNRYDKNLGINRTNERIHWDECHLEITRETPSGRVRRYSFMFDVSICANNTARMLRFS